MTQEKYDRFERYTIPNTTISIDREIPRCISECPAFCNVKDYVELIAEGKYKEAYNVITDTIPFPATIGRICERPCEDECKRGFFDEPIAIRALKRFASEKATDIESTTPTKSKEAEKIAIIGSGPGGLTAAADLSRKGYDVTVFEKKNELGGMLRLIPNYKLPKDILDGEIEKLIEKYEMNIETDCKVGEDVDFEKLEKDYNAVIVGTGLPEDRALDLEGSDLEGIDTALSFLEKTGSGEKGPVDEDDRVIIIGGGNTAINSARTAHRLGAEVKVVYRRSEEQMPAGKEKVKEAEEEGIDFVFLASPSKILGDEKVEEVQFDLMKLGEPDESGRKRPIPIEDSNMSMKADYLIWAIGQNPETSFLENTEVELDRGIIEANLDTLTTDKESIFAVGDVIRGPATAVEAIGDGHRVAESIDRFLQGEDLEEGRKFLSSLNESDEDKNQLREELMKAISVSGESRKEREKMPKLGPSERKNSFDEVKTGFSENSAVEEAGRCFACKGCQINVVTEKKESDVDIDKKLERLMKSTDVVKCIDCGECTSSCPVTEIDDKFSPRRLARSVMIGIDEETNVVIHGDEIWKCTTCGVCNNVCPYEVDFVSFVKGLREIASIENSTPRYSESGMVREQTSGDEKLSWVADELEVSDEGDIYYFSGCLPYLDWVYNDRRNLNLGKIPENAVKILNSIGVVPAVSESEVCCGHDLLWRGETEKVKELAEDNIEAIKETGAETVVFTCPEGLRTFKEDYSEILEENPDLEFVHITEFLKDKDVPLREEWEEEKLTYHDACRMKQLEIFDEPREILQEVPNTSLTEMKKIKEKAPCCGVNAMSTCSPTAREMQILRLEEAIDTGAEKLVVPCPKCWIHLDCELSSNSDLKDDFSIEELTNFLGNHLIPS